MVTILTTLAAAGLLGCFVATLGVDILRRGASGSDRRLRRPRRVSMQRD